MTDLTEAQRWVLDMIDSEFAILGPAKGDGQRLSEAERDDLIARGIVSMVPLEVLEGQYQPNGRWTPEYIAQIRERHGATTMALMRASSARALEYQREYLTRQMA